MSWLLYRLGRWSFAHRWIVLGAWVVILVGSVVGAGTLSGNTSDQFSMPGLESTDAFELIKERTPGVTPDGATARVVLQAPEGESLEGYRETVDALVASLATESVVVIAPPFESGTISPDGRTGYITVQYQGISTELTDADLGALDAAPAIGSEAGLLVAVGGDAVEAIPELGTAELLGVAVAVVVLLVTLGSLVAAGMPLVTALIGVGVGVSLITAASGFMDLGSTTPLLATMLGLAVGIDYALFIVSRYQHEVAIGRVKEDAAGRAVGTAGSAVVFAGMTVVIALVGLSVVQIELLTEMGVAAAVTVVMAVLIALTLLPALFGFAGDRINTPLPFVRGKIDPEGEPSNGARHGWATLITQRRGMVLAAGLAVAVIVSIPVASMNLALPDQGSSPEESGPRVAYDLITESFGAGANGPLMVVVDTAGSADPLAAVELVNTTVSRIGDGIAAVIPAGPAAADEESATQFAQQLEMAQYAIVTVIPATGPAHTDTQDLVDRLRGTLGSIEGETGARVLVTGQTALMIDVSDELASAFPRYLAVVIGLALLLLLVVFRSILVPVKAVLGFLISVLGSLGITVAVTQWGWGASLLGIDTPGPLLSLMPLLLSGILFGLAMDYELFLVSRIREEFVHGRNTDQSIIAGFQHGARVISAAAIIMISVFGSFALIDDPMLKTIGFGLAVGVLIDAFLVRMTILPAFMSLVGDRIWWLPAWLDRILPNLDVEGEGLAKHLDRERGAGVAVHAGGEVVATASRD